MKRKNKFIQGISVYITGLGILWLFLIGAALIPNHFIKENMVQSSRIIGKSEAFAYCDGDRMNGIADNYADSIWLNVAWFMGKGNPVISSVNTRYYDGDGQGQNVGLYLAVTEATTLANIDYTRYWHGTAGVIRILHLFTDVNGIRYLGFMFVLGLAAILMIFLIKKGKDSIALAFFLSLCAVKIWNLRLSMEYQPAYIIGFFICVLYLLLEKRGNDALVIPAIIGGELIAFFDFLTTETVTILLPLILIVTVRALENRLGTWKENRKFLFVQGMLWILSYAVTIGLKWILASIVLGENQLVSAISSVQERINGSVALGEEKNPMLQVLAAPAANLTVLFGGTKRIDKFPLMAGTLLVIVFCIIFVIGMVKTTGEKKTAIGMLFGLGTVILLRYMILSNHSYLHSFFTYRGMISFIMAMLSIVILNRRKV